MKLKRMRKKRMVVYPSLVRRKKVAVVVAQENVVEPIFRSAQLLASVMLD